MRLALVTETFLPEVNGVAMTLGRLRDGLGAIGWEVDVIRPRQKGETVGERPGEKRVGGLPLPFYPTLRMGTPAWLRLRRWWKAQRPDVVHIATEGPLGLAALVAARGLKIPVTSSFHTNFHEYGGHYGLNIGGALAVRYLRIFHNRTSRTFAPTAEMCASLEKLGFARTRVMSRGVDAELFAPSRRSEALRREWGAGPEDRVLLYVGRLAAEKNLSLAVEAFLASRAAGGATHFVLVGDGPELPGLRAKYPHFHYAGMRRGQNLAAHYASADAFAFPSLTETFGNVVTEAMASGLPCVAFDYAAGREVLAPSGGGWVAPVDKPDLFIARVVELCSEPARMREMGVRARQAAEGRSWATVAQRFAADLEDVRREASLR